MFMAMFDPEVWAQVPFHFWSCAFFVFGTTVGSFLNVIIHRVPRGESSVSPPSHCPLCQYAIPWYLNIPLITWLWLRGRCAHCRAPISPRYFLVEFLTGVLFLLAWWRQGPEHPGVALILCLFMAGLVAATFIDFEHFIIPESITFGGMAAGVLLSPLAPALHGKTSAADALLSSLVGMGAGCGLVYGILRGGKLLFGRKKIALPPDATVIFGEESLKLPEEEIPYGEMLYRDSDYIEAQAKKAVLGDEVFENVRVRLYKDRLEIGEQTLDPGPVTHLEVVTDKIIIPQEAMGLGDVFFMGAIGAFVGWQGVVFTLLGSSLVGALAGVTLIVLRRLEWSRWIPYGPYLALAATVWVFAGPELVNWLLRWGERTAGG
jgi:leader peptidase (prepilin peptidase)/N-methyltransferase